jgi:MoxR-like ATPase
VNRNDISDRLAAVGYVADRDIATALWLMEYLKRPLLLEGEAGVGKTEVAKSLAAVHEAELIRLQCYEGLDQNAALYEWNYQRQLLAIKTREGVGENANAIEEHIFSERYLLERPLLAAIRREKPPVLLVDEVDRADEEFEAFLLELLSDFQVSIPELGTIKATSIPRVVLTSNGTRELSDALRRRCLYHYVDFPDVDREARIIVTTSMRCWRCRSRAWFRPCARRTYGRSPAWPRHSTGRRRSLVSASTICGRNPKPSTRP